MRVGGAVLASICAICLITVPSCLVAGQPDPGASDEPFDIDITSKRLDAARQQIQPSLGATKYQFDQQALQAIPQGSNANVNQVVLQSPGVWQDSFGQIHIRGEHADVQYRIDGVQLPEGLSFFGQALESRLANSVSVLTGTLPAQYGINTAGVIDIQTKTGFTSPGLAISMYGGSWGWLQPSFEEGGHSGPVDWFISGDYLHNDRGIDNPTFHYGALHDTTNQFHGFAHVSGILDENTRLSLLVGAYSGQFQIPNSAGQPTTPGLSVNGISTYSSAVLNENQRESANFGMLTLQKHTDVVDAQIALFSRNNYLHFTPDPLGDLLFNGISQVATRSDFASGIQADASWKVAEDHTLRGGVLFQGERASFNTLSSVLPVDATGAQSAPGPTSFGQGGGKTGWLYGIYLQDEWRILQALTINYGARFDQIDAFTNENQISPRINMVWKATPGTTVHAGYARYFAPPPLEAVTQTNISAFQNTTAAPAVTENDPVRAARSNYFDAGVTQKLLPGLQVGLDTYYQNATNEGDVGQFGAPIILTAFSYARARIYGGELTTNYESGPWSAYANIGWARSEATGISSAQFNFGADELAYINSHWISVDHDQRWTGSAGISYRVNRDTGHPTLLSVDFLSGSGLRASTPTVPNGAALPGYGVVNLSVVQKLKVGVGTGTDLRLDVLNAGDTIYEIRNGTGVSVGAPQYGLRRTILAGITQRF
ncbi:MAG TPA: TonB-dependent receptor [Rhodopila sp.]|jgi:outer membrane receptor protein involved in Fe transport